MMERVRLTQPRGITILDCLDDPNIFAPFFKSPENLGSMAHISRCSVWFSARQSQADTFRECTGRQEPPDKAAREAYLVIGRRGGKSFVLALIGVFLACFRDYRKYLAPGERATVMVIASDRKQARTVLRMSRAFSTCRCCARSWSISAVSTSTCSIVSPSRSTPLASRAFVVIRSWPRCSMSWRSGRPMIVQVIPISKCSTPFDRAWQRSRMRLLLCASSPYARKGVLYDAYRKHFGKDGDILVWQAPTRTMNPSIPQSLIERELDRDRAYARS